MVNKFCCLIDRHNHDVFTENPIPERKDNHLAECLISQKFIESCHPNQETYQEDYNDIPSIMISPKEIRKSEASEQLWHQRLGHPGPEVIKLIESSSVSVSKKGPKANECENCALNKATKIIS